MLRKIWTTPSKCRFDSNDQSQDNEYKHTEEYLSQNESKTMKESFFAALSQILHIALTDLIGDDKNLLSRTCAINLVKVDSFTGLNNINVDPWKLQSSNDSSSDPDYIYEVISDNEM